MSDTEPTTNPPDSDSPPQLAEDIQEGAQQEIATAQPDPAAVAAEKSSLEAEKLSIENSRLKDELEEAKDLHKIRKSYIDRMFILIVVWLLTVIVFVTLSASRKNTFSLSDNVLIAFITSTTVSVLGLFIIAAKWLFPSSGKGDGDKRE